MSTAVQTAWSKRYIRIERFDRLGQEPCETDKTPQGGCKGGPSEIQVCGLCGMSDSSYPGKKRRKQFKRGAKKSQTSQSDRPHVAGTLALAWAEACAALGEGMLACAGAGATRARAAAYLSGASSYATCRAVEVAAVVAYALRGYPLTNRGGAAAATGIFRGRCDAAAPTGMFRGMGCDGDTPRETRRGGACVDSPRR